MQWINCDFALVYSLLHSALKCLLQFQATALDFSHFRSLSRQYNNNIYLLQLGCHPVAVVILHVNKTRNRLLLNLSREGYVRSM